jgi:hypothetical protein
MANGGGAFDEKIGARLGITTRTLAFHKYRFMEKLAVRSTAELVRVAAPTAPSSSTPVSADSIGLLSGIVPCFGRRVHVS